MENNLAHSHPFGDLVKSETQKVRDLNRVCITSELIIDEHYAPNYKGETLREEISRLRIDYVNLCRLHDEMREGKEKLDKENAQLRDQLKNGNPSKSEEVCKNCNQEIGRKLVTIKELEARVQRREASIGDWRNKCTGQKGEIERLRKQRDDQNSEIDQLKKIRDDARKEIETLNEENLKKEKQVENCRKVIADHCRSELESKSRLDKLQAELLQQKKEVEKLTNAVSTLQQSEKAKLEKIQCLQEKNSIKENAMQDLNQIIAENKQTLDAQDVVIQQLEADIAKKESQAVCAQETISTLQECVKEKSTQIQVLTDECTKHKGIIRLINDQLLKERNETERHLDANSKLRQSESEKNMEISKLQNDVKALQQQLSIKIAEVKAQLKLVGDLKEQVEVFAPAIDENKCLLRKIKEKDETIARKEQQVKNLEREACQKLSELEKKCNAKIANLEAILKLRTGKYESAQEDCKTWQKFAEEVKKLITKRFNESFDKWKLQQDKQHANPLPTTNKIDSQSNSETIKQQLGKVKKTITKNKTKCSYCPKKYSDRSVLNMHTKKVHENHQLCAETRENSEQPETMSKSTGLYEIEERNVIHNVLL